VERCGAGLVEGPTPLVMDQVVDVTGTWQLVLVNKSLPQSFVLSSTFDTDG
jgi:hypothetical protein